LCGARWHNVPAAPAGTGQKRIWDNF